MTKYAELNWIKHPARTMQELIEARKKFDDGELKDAVEEKMDQCFPNWQNKDAVLVSSWQKTPTKVQFGDKQNTFPSAKKAYVWLVEKILNTRTNLKFSDAVFKKMFIEGTHGARYLALKAEELFPAKSKDQIREMKDTLWHELPNGWALNLNLSNKQKIDRLFALSAVCKLEYKKDWSWHVEGEEESDLSDFDEHFLKIFPDYKA